MKWKTIKAREILDSRGMPTIEVDLYLEDGRLARASVPCGASTGTHEALERRDKNPARFGGRGVRQACESVEKEIAAVLAKTDMAHLPEVDQKLIELDGTPNKARLGANAILAVSLAAAKAGALLKGMPLYRHLGELYGNKTYKIPTPLLNVINGGRHADNNLNVQEFMIVPWGAPTFAEALRMAAETFMHLKTLIAAAGDSCAVGDEGGLAPRLLKEPAEALNLLMEAIAQAGYKGKIGLSLDLAASEFYENGGYRLFKNKPALSVAALMPVFKQWAEAYPMISMEDPMAEDDWEGWRLLTGAFHQTATLLIGDDLFVTNKERLGRGLKEGVANAILIKPNQIGTLTETAAVVNLAKKNGYGTIASHRSGETEDSVLAHIAVGLGVEGIKTGSVTRSERLAKYNELLRIEEELGAAAYQGSRLSKSAIQAGAKIAV